MDSAGNEQNVNEARQTLEECEAELALVEEDLAANPNDPSLLEIKKSITEVMELAKQVLAKDQEEGSEANANVIIAKPVLNEREKEPKRVEPVSMEKGYVIPKRLLPRPTDTAEERKMKKRKIHAIKNKHKENQQNEFLDGQRNVWTNHTKKKKSKTGKHQSIFVSPTTATGRVGVVNSGRAMTQIVGRTREQWAFTLPKADSEKQNDDTVKI